MDLYNKLKWRGMIKDVSNEEGAAKLLNEEKVKFYVGYDPTGESLTVGHLVQIVRMKYLQNYGHIPVVLIGGGTGLIGDPRETTERKLLTVEDSLKNAKKIEDQIKTMLTGNAIYVNNYDWLGKLSMIEFLRDYGKNFNISYMVAKDTVAKRLESGISFTEFSYMILQSIDWLHMYQTMDVKIQFGGSDQWGNITAGLDLIRKHVGENDAIGLSSPLLLKTDGTKFGKSETGAIWLSKELTTPYEMYQYFLNTSDDDLENYLKLLTTLEQDEIESLLLQTKKEPELRAAQKVLASNVVRFVHGDNELKVALDVTDALFSGDFSNLDLAHYLQLEKVLDTALLSKDSNILEALKETKLASSNREAREFINNHAVTINGNKVERETFLLKDAKIAYNHYLIIKRGKKRYALVKIS